MSTDEIKQAVAEGIQQALADPKFHCRYQIEPDEHARQHEAMVKFISFTTKIDNLGWSVLKKLVAYIVIGAFSLMVYGAIIKAKYFGGP